MRVDNPVKGVVHLTPFQLAFVLSVLPLLKDKQTGEDTYEISPDGIVLLKFWTILGFVQIFDTYIEHFISW